MGTTPGSKKKLKLYGKYIKKGGQYIIRSEVEARVLREAQRVHMENEWAEGKVT